MAEIINIVLQRQSVSGLVCRNTRQTVILGAAAKGDTVDKLSADLLDTVLNILQKHPPAASNV